MPGAAAAACGPTGRNQAGPMYGVMRRHAVATSDRSPFVWGGKCIPQGLLNTLMWQPEWIPADQPTEHLSGDGKWLKLRL